MDILNVANRPRRKIQIGSPLSNGTEEEFLLEEVRKFKKLIPSEPEPNLGRVCEIKEEIKKGTYFTPEVIEETAARLSIRFTQEE